MDVPHFHWEVVYRTLQQVETIYYARLHVVIDLYHAQAIDKAPSSGVNDLVLKLLTTLRTGNVISEAQVFLMQHKRR
jgi:hypothetical protein